MKKILGLMTILAVVAVYSYGQKSETFDIISYKTPTGWQKQIQQKRQNDLLTGSMFSTCVARSLCALR